MHLFSYRGGRLFAEQTAVSDLTEAYGTPLYVYSHGTLLKHLKAYQEAFDGLPHIVCFALKANSNGSILRLFAKNGGGADVVSGGEIFRALQAGVPPRRIVYAGVGKTEEEIRFALRTGILMFNVESGDELMEIDRVAGAMRRRAPIALRINPDIDPGTHPYISTGLKKHKFGIPIEEALEFYRLAERLKHVQVVGIHKHIGSQITRVAPFVEALKRTLLLVDDLEKQGIAISHLDIGGGLGITYLDEKPPLPSDLARQIVPLLRKRKLTVIMEPGRSIVGNAGILVTRVLYLKKRGRKTFVIVDAGMNDLMRPSLYGAYHHIQPLEEKKGLKTMVADVVGPICESGDFLAKDREMPAVEQGDLLAVMSAGAYGFSMSSRYNSRPAVAEVLVKGRKHGLVRRRETYKDLVRGEMVPDFI